PAAPAAHADLRRTAPAGGDGPRDRPQAAGVPARRATVQPGCPPPRGAAAHVPALSRRLGVTTVYVTHDQVEAMTMADRVAVLRKGVLQQIGPPEQVYSDPA